MLKQAKCISGRQERKQVKKWFSVAASRRFIKQTTQPQFGTSIYFYIFTENFSTAPFGKDLNFSCFQIQETNAEVLEQCGLSIIDHIWSNVTFEWFPLMNWFSMHFRITFIREICLTSITFEWFFVMNRSNMPIQITFLCKIWWTNIAFECFFSFMNWF